MTAEDKVQLRRVIEMIREIDGIIREILDRPAPESRGRIAFEDAVIELPVEGAAWERHDDPTV